MSSSKDDNPYFSTYQKAALQKKTGSKMSQPLLGLQISEVEFERRLKKIHAMPQSEGVFDVCVPREILDLKIDRKIGVDFPIHRRRQVWQCQLDWEKTPFQNMLKGWIKNPRHPSKGLLIVKLETYSKGFGIRELSAFFGIPVEDIKLLLKRV